MFSPTARRAAPVIVALLITAYGGLLRLDAVVHRYGTVEHPGWARMLTHAVPGWAAPVKPAAHEWQRIATPYVGGDPINYLRFAREMRTFYQAHVREPVFLAWTKAFLWLLDDQDIAISFASAAGSTLAIFAAYLLASAVVSPVAALVVAALIAGEYDLITWGMDGWRDDTFMVAVVLAAWGFVRLQGRPSFANALLAGTVAGLACLTRITALSFVAPALLLLVLGAPRAQRWARARKAGLAALVCAALVGPYLVSCAIATGDPFYAINYHTVYYRFGEGLPIEKPMSAAEYISGKVAGHPLRVLDTALMGLFVQPFVTKFHGYEGYAPHIGAALAWCSAAGMLLLPFVSAGRMLLVILLASLLPYAFTWNVSSGGEWRFTMHAYPLYLVAALFAVDRACRPALALWRGRAEWRRPSRRILIRTAAVLSCATLGWAAYIALPWFVVREAVALREDVSIEAGPRDRLFFGEGWSAPHRDGVLVRVSRRERTTVRFPLPERRSYDIVVRLDPVAPDLQRRMTLLLNRQLLGTLHLRSDPIRMGAYRLHLPQDQVRTGSNELTIVPDALVSAASAGPRFAWLDPVEQIGIRLWYVRVLAPGPIGEVIPAPATVPPSARSQPTGTARPALEGS